MQKLIIPYQDLICPHSPLNKTLQPQPRLFLELVHQAKYLHVLNFTASSSVSRGIWSILMLFFKAVLTVEHIELQKPFYFNKKKNIFIIYLALNGRLELISFFPSNLYFYMVQHFFLNHTCLFSVAILSNAI